MVNCTYINVFIDTAINYIYDREFYAFIKENANTVWTKQIVFCVYEIKFHLI